MSWRALDEAVWRAHLRRDRILDESADPEKWARYRSVLIEEARLYWHGVTGRLFERLGLGEGEWARYVDLERERYGEPACLGDSSLESFFLIEAANGLTPRGERPFSLAPAVKREHEHRAAGASP